MEPTISPEVYINIEVDITIKGIYTYKGGK